MSLHSVNTASCARDHLCVEVCPLHLLEPGPDGYPRSAADAADACVECGHCVAICRKQALRHETLPLERFARSQPRGAIAADALDGFLRSRRSCRAFKREPLSREEIAALLDTVRFAPTASNAQGLRWIVSDAPETTRELATLAMGFLGKSTRYAHLTRGSKDDHDAVLRGAPHVVVALAPANVGFGDIDGATALCFLDLTANAHGFATCWAGLFLAAARNDAEVRRRLGVPDGFAVAGAMMLGRPKYSYALVPIRNDAEIAWLGDPRATRP